MIGVFFIPSSLTSRLTLLDVNLIHHLLAKVQSVKLLEKLEYILRSFDEKYTHYLYLKNNYVNKSRYDDLVTSFLKFVLQSAFELDFRKMILNLLWDNFMCESQEDVVKNLYLNKDDLHRMQSFNMVIGGHGHDHVHLSKVSLEIQQAEIKESSLFLDGLCNFNEHPKCFAYPYGSYDYRTLELLRAEGFELGFTTNPVNDNIKFTNLEIPRLDTNDI